MGQESNSRVAVLSKRVHDLQDCQGYKGRGARVGGCYGFGGIRGAPLFWEMAMCRGVYRAQGFY